MNAFSQEVGRMGHVPIIDVAVAYDCPFTNVTFILIARNVPYVPSMMHNFIPPFILREAGIEANDTAKIHVTDPKIEDHSVLSENKASNTSLFAWYILVLPYS